MFWLVQVNFKIHCQLGLDPFKQSTTCLKSKARLTDIFNKHRILG